MKSFEIDDDDVLTLLELIKKNSNIKQLNLLNNVISCKGAARLAELTLDSLNLSCNPIGPEGARALSQANIKRLILDACPIKEGAEFFFNAPHITELSLSECSIPDKSARAVLSNCTLTKLDLSSNHLTDIFSDLKEGLEKSSLEVLNLDQNELDCKKHFDGVFLLKNLRKLDLGSNRIDWEAAESFVELFVEKNQSIRHLDLDQNRITGKGFLKLCSNPALETLNVCNNRIKFEKNDGLFSPPQILNLTRLDMDWNCLDEDAAKVLLELVQTPKLSKLNLRENHELPMELVTLLQDSYEKNRKALRENEMQSVLYGAICLLKIHDTQKLKPAKLPEIPHRLIKIVLDFLSISPKAKKDFLLYGSSPYLGDDKVVDKVSLVSTVSQKMITTAYNAVMKAKQRQGILLAHKNVISDLRNQNYGVR